MARRATSLGPKPSLFFLFFFLFFVFFFVFFFFLFFFCFFFFSCFCLFVFFGGFKGQVRWPKGPPHQTLKPSLFNLFLFCFFVFLFFCFLFFCFVCFLVLASARKKTCFPP